ncbi:MAG: ATP-dependent DNA ligase [Candidatus Methanomethylophilaceae archaeon]|nr:ATP-dependent DNA ligase [Candidatus Methanomethylophilaceae archaeon]
MLYSDLADTFDRLESTSSRLEMTTILADFFRDVDKDELRDIVYLCQGKLHPDFHPQVLGMSDKLVLKAIAKASGYSESEAEEQWLKTGDPGAVAEMFIGGKPSDTGAKKVKQASLFSFGDDADDEKQLTVGDVVAGLVSIENTDGKKSQAGKIDDLVSLLRDSSPVGARYLCRIVTGRMRVGAGDMTILDALAEAFATKEDRPVVERAFNVTCDIGLVAETIATGGMDAVAGIGVQVGNPVKVMLGERLPSIGEVVEKLGGTCAMEYKYDGIRLQAHINGDKVTLYSRRLEDLTSNFPDVAYALASKCKFEEAIVEGECVAVEPETGFMLPFQVVTHRRKKHGMEQAVKSIPVRMFMFDILYRDGEDMTARPYLERRAELESTFALGEMLQMTTMKVVENTEEGEEFFSNALAARCEGIMAKSVARESVYRAGSRGFLWIKYKKDYQQALTDSFDLAVVGAFYGMGKRAGKYGALLMAAFDQETGMFQTVCKLGTGFDDAFLDSMPELLNGTLTSTKPRSVETGMEPDVWFDPEAVLEVVAAEITQSPTHTVARDVLEEGTGLGLRFPRFTGRVRDDKTPEQCTTSNEILDMYNMQVHDSDGISDE